MAEVVTLLQANLEEAQELTSVVPDSSDNPDLKATERRSLLRAATATKKTVFDSNQPNSREGSKKAPNSWQARLRKRVHQGAGALRPPHYEWLKETMANAPKPRIMTFKTIGRAPIEAPVSQVRLTPVRLMSPTPTFVDDDLQEGEASGGEDTAADLQYPPRSISRQCRHLLMEQSPVAAFDVMSIYLSCEFFKACSVCFVREMVAAGGPPALKGVSIPPHVNVYAEGDPGHCMFVVARGSAAVVDRRGRPQRELGISDYFGGLEVLGITGRRLETICAKTSLQLLVLTQTTLTKMLKRPTAQEDEMLKNANKAPENSTALKQSQLMGIHTHNTFDDERRHFEVESVRLYKEYIGTGVRANVKPRPTLSPRRTLSSNTFESQVGNGEASRRASEQQADALAAASADHADAMQARERLFAKTVSSLRHDMRMGFMMPADSFGGAGASKQKSFASPRRQKQGHKPAGGDDRDLVPVASETKDDDQASEEKDDETFAQDVAAPLDPHLLPPLHLLNPVQKHGILRQLRHQNKGQIGQVVKAAPSLGYERAKQRGRASVKPWCSQDDIIAGHTQQGMTNSASMKSMINSSSMKSMINSSSMASVTTGTGGDDVSVQFSQGSRRGTPERD